MTSPQPHRSDSPKMRVELLALDDAEARPPYQTLWIQSMPTKEFQLRVITRTPMAVCYFRSEMYATLSCLELTLHARPRQVRNTHSQLPRVMVLTRSDPSMPYKKATKAFPNRAWGTARSSSMARWLAWAARRASGGLIIAKKAILLFKATNEQIIGWSSVHKNYRSDSVVIASKKCSPEKPLFLNPLWRTFQETRYCRANQCDRHLIRSRTQKCLQIRLF